MGTHTRILKKYNRRCSKRYSKKSKRHTRKNIYSKTYKKIQKGGFLCKKVTAELETTKTELETTKKNLQIANIKLENAERASKIATKELDQAIIYNKENMAAIRTLRWEKTNLLTELKELKDKLNEQTSPTDKEIAKLDNEDRQNIDNILSRNYYKNAENSEFHSVPIDHVKELKNYEERNRESVTKEYIIEQLRKKQLMENPTA